jgi:hypothetical protein
MLRLFRPSMALKRSPILMPIFSAGEPSMTLAT